MDSDRFDDLSRTLATRRTRRAVLGAIGASLAGLVTGQSAGAVPKKAKPSKCYGDESHCTNGKQCCSGTCTNRQCAPEVEAGCSTAADCPATGSACQVATCADGVCGVENVAAGAGCDGGVCDGNGGCAGCLTSADCVSAICDNGACVPSCEELSNFGASCTVGIGACLRDGFFVCAPDGVSLICNAVSGTPSQEISNDIDDDCDGRVDEDIVVSCDDGYDHCTSEPTDVCETSILDDARNCGGCGVVCPLAETGTFGEICTNGVCICYGDDDCPLGLSCIEGSYPIPGYCS